MGLSTSYSKAETEIQLYKLKQLFGSGIHDKPLKITDPIPTDFGGYVLKDIGSYSFGITTEPGKYNVAFLSQSGWELIAIDMFSEPIKVVFSPIIKFDAKKKYSTINQTADINFTFDSTGSEKNAVVKIEIVSDGIHDINFSSDFEVFGDIDNSKNQVIYFSKESLIEFKISAIVMNVAKSGNVTPQPSGTYEERIQQVGATLTSTEQTAWTNFKNAAVTNGYFSKLIGLYLALGSNQNAKLLNAIDQNHNLTPINISSLNNAGFKGCFDTNIKPSDVTTNADFSFGVYSATNIVENSTDIGCTIGSAVHYMAIKYSGNIIYAGGNDTGPGTSEIGINNPNNSDGFYIMNRTSSTNLKLFRNNNLITQKTESNSSQNPNVNVLFGGSNINGNPGSFSSRTYKMAFYGKGLSDQNIIDFNNDILAFLNAIGR